MTIQQLFAEMYGENAELDVSDNSSHIFILPVVGEAERWCLVEDYAYFERNLGSRRG